MTFLHCTVPEKEKSLKRRIRYALSGSVLFMSGMPNAWPESSGLPVSPNAVQPNMDLTSPSLHHGYDVGVATGTYSADEHKLTIKQSSNTTTLDWNSFDIAAGNTVQFVQPGTTSIALNNIHQLNASQIFGNLTANGQVYLVNNNGFVFGAHASVNVNSLVASSLDITDSVFQKGIANVVTSGAQSSGQGSTSSKTAVAAFTGDGTVYRKTGNGTEKIRILVEKDAVINSGDTGRVILAAPEVVNKGKITAPDGQVILVAATDKVYLQESSSSDLRGLLVEVNTGGDVKNVGTILTERGNTTMLGFAVSQQGIVSASTSVALNGSVRLLAREGAQLVNSGASNTKTNFILEPVANSTTRSSNIGDGLGTRATVTFAPGSTTEITLDDSGGKAVNSQRQPQSIVDVEAGYIDMQSGSKIVAHGGRVDMTASLSPIKSNIDFAELPTLTPSPDNNSRILLEAGSSIDVSGVQKVAMAMSDNFVGLTLYSYELRNDPLQKHGLLYGQKVQVDTRLGTKLADITGAIANIQYSVGYRNSHAGTVNLNSEGDVLVQQGANINISGGSLDYLGGVIQTTDLVSNGRLYTMASADPNLIYQQIFNKSYYQSGYIQGMNAGIVNINSRDLVLEGNVLANTVNGVFQRSAASMSTGGQLNIDTTWTNQSQQDVIFQNAQTNTAIPKFGSIPTKMYLSDALFGNGLNGLDLKTGGNLTISSDARLNLTGLGKLSLQAGTIDVEGRINASGGSVTLSTNVYHSLSGLIHLGKGSIIDTSGQWINDPVDRLNGQTLKTLVTKAGAISLQAQGDLLLDSGSKLTANGGGWLQNNFTLSAGEGGNISLSTVGNNVATRLQLGATLSSYAFNKGGELSLTANSIDIAGTVPKTSDPYTLHLASSLLESGGFSGYNLTANAGNLAIAAGTSIVLQQDNWLPNAAAYRAASGSNLSTLPTGVLAENLRNPVNLSLSMKQSSAINGYVADRSLSLGKNAEIIADANAALTLTSDANISIDGTLTAPAGNVTLAVGAPGAENTGYNPNQAIVLGADAHLSTRGVTVMSPNAAGLRLGDVLDGGTVSLTANRGTILMDNQSTIDVSGANASLDIINDYGISRQNIASNGGFVNLTAAEGMALQGRFIAQAGAGSTAGGWGSSAAGGSLAIELNAQNRGQPDSFLGFPNTDRVIHVSSKPVSLLNSQQIAGGVIPTSLNGQAYISTSQITQAGFDSLKLKSFVNLTTQSVTQPEPQNGTILFDGDVNLALKLSLELDAPQIGHSWKGAIDTGKVNLNSDMFILGSSQNQTPLGTLTDPSKAYSSGKPAELTVNANNIELRGSSMINGFAKTTLNSYGDISLIGVNPNFEHHLLGSLSLTGELDLSAREIFPTTMSQFSINVDAALSPDGLVKISPALGRAYTPLSAAGELTINAPRIESHGNLLAPFGKIKLNATTALTLAAGSLTSVADDNNIMIPFGYTQGNGRYWYYPLGNSTNLLDGTPEKAISLASPDINLQSGAVVNLNGGGDLSAYEFIPAPGGSIDYLSPGYQQSYAILPGFHSGFAPYDPLVTASAGLSLGENIYLSAATGVAAGNYVLLPAYYALLPDAYLITPQAGAGNMAAGTTSTLADGTTVVAGYLKTEGSNVTAIQWAGFAVQPGSVALNYSPYQVSIASRHFSDYAPTGSIASLPQDAGNLSLLAQHSLSLAGQITATAAAGGLGGQLDISAEKLAIVNQLSASIANDTVAINVNDLNKLGVDSILFGGLRTRSNSGTALTVSAKSIEVAAGVALKAPEVILAASNSVTVDSGANISAVSSLSRTDSLLNIANEKSSSTDGALLRVSNATQASVFRDSSRLDKQSGTLTVAAGAELASSGSIFLDASKTGSFLGSIQMPKGQLTIRGSLITLGGEANANAGFQLSEATLNQLHVNSLSLNSYSSINIDSDVDLHLGNLVMDSAGINGYAAADQTASIDADNIILLNSANAKPVLNPTGSGQLQLHAGTITLGSGDYSLKGFSQIDLNATSALIDSGTSTITANSHLNITTPVWTAFSGADTTLNLGSNVLTFVASGSSAGSDGLGAKLTVSANQIDDQGRIDMGSGVVNLDAVNSLTLGTNAVIDTSGRAVSLGSKQMVTGGGSISLKSDTANLDIQQGAILNVSGSSLGGDGGNLSLSAAQGTLTLAGDIKGHAYQGSTGGSFTLNALNTSFADFSTLNSLLQKGGFNGDLAVQLGQGDLLVKATDQVTAGNITLTANTGLVDVFGQLNVSGSQAGTIRLSGNQGVLIESGASLSAISGNAANQGGKIVLTSDPVVNQGAEVLIAEGANVNVSGGKGGTVQAIVNRIATNGIYNDAAINIAHSALHGYSSLIVDAMAHYVKAQPGDNQFQQWLADSQGFLDAAAQNTDVQARLGGFELQPGLDIQSASSLDWNIGTALTGQVRTPGLLSIRSAADVNINNTLSDGFTQGSKTKWILQSGPSWSYNIVAGADLQSANLQDSRFSNGTGNLTIGSNTSVRTGTGDIYLAAADNISLTDATSTVYTAGQAGLLTIPSALTPKNGTFVAQFPEHGGDVTLNAGGNIKGATSPQIMSDWLQRANIASTNTHPSATAWGIDFGYADPGTRISSGTSSVNIALGFYENIGALGGGNVRIHAAGNIQDLSAMLPTNGLLTVVNGVSVLQEQGGGNLNVTAGGNIAGGVFYVEKGYADISAKGAIVGSTQSDSGPIFGIGNAQFNVSAGSGIQVGLVTNPFVIAQAGVKDTQKDYFTTYTANSAINLQSLGGDITLNNDTKLITDHIQTCFNASCIGNNTGTGDFYNNLNGNIEATSLLTMYPGNLTAYALSGGLQIENSMSLYSSPGSSFNLLAAGDITLADNVVLSQLDADPSQLVPVTQPVTTFSPATAYWSSDNYASTYGHAAVPVHQADTSANQIVSANGSIIGLGASATVASAKAINVTAAQDLNNLGLLIQNLNTAYQDMSTLNVGRDIIFPTQRNAVTGDFQGSGFIEVAGPGWLNVWAGRNVDLGVSSGITSVGSQLNSALLGSSGANITVLAGEQLSQSSQPLNDYLQFYVTNPGYKNSLSAQLSALYQQPASTGNQQLESNLEDLLAAIDLAKTKLDKTATISACLQLALPILFDQFRLVATEVNTSQGKPAYQAGYDAINRLFPTKTGGDIILDFSLIQTFEGGNITLLAPGGMINVGLASSDITADKTEANLGVVTQAHGDINILTQGDLQVNQSRVFTLESGDITAWASNGNIDAGRGAKSSIGTQLPVGSFDSYGNLILKYPPTVSGSGLGAQSGYNSNDIGNVTLVAPHGVVNANEAGIRGHDITIAAVAVIGAININATGSSLGVPQPISNIALPDSVGNSAAAAAKAANNNLDDENNSTEKQSRKVIKVAVLDTQVVGFGSCSVGDIREGRQGCGMK